MSVFIDNEKCEGCDICVTVCPLHAISIIKGKAFIDQNSCTECLQCINECPNDAIRQISAREVSLKTRERPIPYFEDKTIPRPRQIFSSNKWNPQISVKGGIFLNELKKAINNFFQVDSSFSMSRKSERRKYGRHRRSRGGRF
ncbi:MAG: 4Fe-4S dicluster domain-containing protein [Candidatus Aminicenantes bacterium]|nr:4Fe-4S dicluster domain-containing protein [Candidatus Aminicenantes bacterium]